MIYFGIAVLILIGLLFLGPRQHLDGSAKFDPCLVGNDPATYVKSKEAAFDDIREGCEKEIIWAKKAGQKTDLSVIYIHGFSASKEEVRPVPDMLAKALGANLFFARMRGHGRDGDAMGAVDLNEWIYDFEEAFAIGQAIGKRVIIMCCSNGAPITLSALSLKKKRTFLKGIIFVSPNFKLQNRASVLANLAFPKIWAPILMGKEIGFEPVNEGHAKFWTYKYPPFAVVPMVRLLSYFGRLNMSKFTFPALFVFSSKDKIVSPEKIKEVASKWGGPSDSLELELTDKDDPDFHVTIGDIVSPNQTKPAAKAMIEWARNLPD